jgi:hypothetical protein
MFKRVLFVLVVDIFRRSVAGGLRGCFSRKYELELQMHSAGVYALAGKNYILLRGRMLLHSIIQKNNSRDNIQLWNYCGG